jgi:hypothetical protein
MGNHIVQQACLWRVHAVDGRVRFSLVNSASLMFFFVFCPRFVVQLAAPQRSLSRLFPTMSSPSSVSSSLCPFPRHPLHLHRAWIAMRWAACSGSSRCVNWRPRWR